MSTFSAYNLPSMEALVHYLHSAYGFPFKSTWLAAIKAGNYAKWLGLTFSNASKYFPESKETIKVPMVQTHQGVRSTKPKPNKSAPAEVAATETPVPLLPCISTSEIHVYDDPVSKMYTDDCSRLPIRAKSGNQYIMIDFHCDTNTILNAPFNTRGKIHRIAA